MGARHEIVYTITLSAEVLIFLHCESYHNFHSSWYANFEAWWGEVGVDTLFDSF